MRDIIVPAAGCVFIAADWSKVEWLLTLYFAGDEENWKLVLFIRHLPELTSREIELMHEINHIPPQ